MPPRGKANLRFETLGRASCHISRMSHPHCRPLLSPPPPPPLWTPSFPGNPHLCTSPPTCLLTHRSFCVSQVSQSNTSCLMVPNGSSHSVERYIMNTNKGCPRYDLSLSLSLTETHRTVLNQILRQSTTHLADGPFAVLVDYIRILDFDVKRK